MVTVASCLMFGGVSGSAIADTAAIGSLVIPAMIKRGYSRGFAAALLVGRRHAGAADAAVDPVPRLRVHLRRVDARSCRWPASCRRIVAAIGLMAVCMWHGKKTGCDNGDGRLSGRRDLAARRATPGRRC